jgi:CheY-like chemotaxis protein
MEPPTGGTQATQDEALPTERFQEHGETTQPTVLIAEDDADIRLALYEALDEEGYRVWEVTNGRQALRLLRSTSSPLVVILDYQMPLLDGVALLEILATLPAVARRHHFILCSGAGRATMLKRCQPLAQHVWLRFLPKPFALSELSALVAEAIPPPSRAPERS